MFLSAVTAEALVVGAAATAAPGASLCEVMSGILTSAVGLDGLGSTW